MGMIFHVSFQNALEFHVCLLPSVFQEHAKKSHVKKPRCKPWVSVFHGTGWLMIKNGKNAWWMGETYPLAATFTYVNGLRFYGKKWVNTP